MGNRKRQFQSYGIIITLIGLVGAGVFVSKFILLDALLDERIAVDKSPAKNPHKQTLVTKPKSKAKTRDSLLLPPEMALKNRFQGILASKISRSILIDQQVTRSRHKGRLRRVSTYRSDSKYPLIRVEERIEREASGEYHTHHVVAMVADHLLVQFSEESLSVLKVRLNQMGLSFRKLLRSSGLGLIQIPYEDLDSFPHWLAQLENDAYLNLEVVEPDFLVFPTATPNDPNMSDLWGLHNTGQSGGTSDADIDAPEAWDIATGLASVLVGVIDTGIDYNHPDLADRIFINFGEIPGNDIDDDNNGYIDDIHGYDFYNDDGDPYDDDDHGTHVSGTIGGVGNNGIGIVGVNWDVTLLALKMFPKDDSGYTSDAIEAVHYATNMGVHMTSNSWGGGGYSRNLKSMIESANTAGILFVAAAGNDSEDADIEPHYPSGYTNENIISVAATDHHDALASFSNFGANSVDLAAPGVSIYSTIPSASYDYLQGTSMATPHVTGVCALLWSAFPSLDHLTVKEQILSGVDPIPALDGITVTGGRLNAFNALQIAAGPLLQLEDSTLDDTFGNGDGFINPGETIELGMVLKNIGIDPASGLSATISITDDPSAYLSLPGPAQINLESIESNETVVSTQTHSLTVHSSATTPYQAEVTLELEDSLANTWRFPVTINIYTSSIISGRITTLTNSSPISGATIQYSGPSQGLVTSQADGSYSFVGISGEYIIKAKATGFVESAPKSVIVPPSQSDVDFFLGNSQIETIPPLSISVPEGETRLLDFTITNTGNVDLTYEPIGVTADWNTTGLWHESGRRSAVGAFSWYYGLETEWIYEDDAEGYLTSAPFLVPASKANFFFEYWLCQSIYSDVSRLEISTDGETWVEIWKSIEFIESFPWRQELVDLTPYANQIVQLRFYFYAAPYGAGGDCEGMYVDGFKIGDMPFGWLTPQNSSGVVTPSSNQNVTYEIDASKLKAGTYQETIVIRTNDLNASEVRMPLVVHVTPDSHPQYLLHEIDDSTGGNGVGDSNETFSLNVEIENPGSILLDTTNASLTTTSPHLTILSSSSMFPEIPSGQSAINLTPFTVQVSPNLDGAYEAPVNLSLSDEMGRVWNFDFTLSLNHLNTLTGSIISSVDQSPISDAYLYVIGEDSDDYYETSSNEDGSYLFMLPDDTYELTVYTKGYDIQTVQVSVPPNNRMDFSLDSPRLEVSTYPIQCRLLPGMQLSPQFSIGNSGTDTLVWSIQDESVTYSFMDSVNHPESVSYSWIDIQSTGTEIMNLGDDDMVTIPIGFSFPFYKAQYHNLEFSTNGFVSFSKPKGTFNWANWKLPSPFSPMNIIAAFWDDLSFEDRGKAYYQTINPSTFIVQWEDVPYRYNENKRATFQLVLYQTGEFLIQLKQVMSRKYATIGCQNVSKTVGTQASRNDFYPRNKMAIRFIPSDASPWMDLSQSITPELSPGNTEIYHPMIDSSGLSSGQYTSQLVLGTNDPKQFVSYIPISLDVFDTPTSSEILSVAMSPLKDDSDLFQVSQEVIDGKEYPILIFDQIAGGSGTPGIDYTVNGLRYEVQISFDLLTWMNGTDHIVLMSVLDDPNGVMQKVKVRSVVEMGSMTHPRIFLRLKVTRL